MKVRGQLHFPASLLQEKKSVPVYRKLVGPQSRSRRCEEKEILALTRIFFYVNTLFYMATYKQRTNRSSTSCPYHTPHRMTRELHASGDSEATCISSTTHSTRHIPRRVIYNDASLSVGFLRTSDQLVAETSTWQHRTLTTNIHAPDGIRTHNLSRRAAADLRLRPRGYWDRQEFGPRAVQPIAQSLYRLCDPEYRMLMQLLILWSHTDCKYILQDTVFLAVMSCYGVER